MFAGLVILGALVALGSLLWGVWTFDVLALRVGVTAVIVAGIAFLGALATE